MKFEGYYSETPLGHKRDWIGRRIPLVRVVLNKDFPFCFHSDRLKGVYRPAMVLSSDSGSVPMFIQGVSWIPGLNLRSDTWKHGYFLHDSAYSEGGLWLRKIPSAFSSTNWEFVKFTRAQADLLLWEALMCEGANAVERNLIYNGVRIGGRFVWRHG